MMAEKNKRVPFIEQSLFSSKWLIKKDKKGCTVEDVDEFALSTSRPPPPLRGQPPPPMKPREPMRRKTGIETLVDFLDWLDAPKQTTAPVTVASPATTAAPAARAQPSAEDTAKRFWK